MSVGWERRDAGLRVVTASALKETFGRLHGNAENMLNCFGMAENTIYNSTNMKTQTQHILGFSQTCFKTVGNTFGT
jgi:hypothetical protein